MADTYVVHTSGNTANGGGYSSAHTLTWASSWHDGSFGPKYSLGLTGTVVSGNTTTLVLPSPHNVNTDDFYNGCAIFVNGEIDTVADYVGSTGTITLTSGLAESASGTYKIGPKANGTATRWMYPLGGLTADALIGVLMSTTGGAFGSAYAIGAVTDNDTTWIEITSAELGGDYSEYSWTGEETAKVGGALGTVKTCIDLQVAGDVGRLVESATDYEMATGATITDGRKIFLYSAKSSDGSYWYDGCGWTIPVVVATGSAIKMIEMSTIGATLTLDGLELDGGGAGKATACIYGTGNLTFLLKLVNVKIGNATGKQIESASSAFLTGMIVNSDIYGGTHGVYGSSLRSIPTIYGTTIRDATTAGLFIASSADVPRIMSCNIYNNAVGIHFERYGYVRDIAINGCTFNNTVDIEFEYNTTTDVFIPVNHCIFYGTTAFDTDSENTTVGILSTHCYFRNGITKHKAGATGYVTEIESKTLSGDPFVDSTNDDYRLNPASADFASLYDWQSGIAIGALGPGPAPTFPAVGHTAINVQYGWNGTQYTGTRTDAISADALAQAVWEYENRTTT